MKIALGLALWLMVMILGASSFAAEAPAEKTVNETNVGSDEILSGPFSEYGEFDSSDDEAEDEKFFQYGRFFGVGIGGGFTTTTGNASRLYQGGFPTINARLNYWFDFQFALQVAVENSKHNYDVGTDGLTDVNLFRVLFQVKYYFDTRDLSAPITFVGPHLIAGGGFYQRTDNIGSGSTSTTTVKSIEGLSAFGFNFGAGFELTIKPKKVYLQLEGLAHMVQFSDQFDTRFKDYGIPDRTGMWISTSVNLMWCW